MREIVVQREIPAAPGMVWGVYADHRGWVDWAGVKEVVLRREGDPAPNGVGASRVVRAHGIAVEEEILAFEPPKRLVYRLIAGVPVRNHQGEVTLEATERGTLVTWRICFEPRIPFTGALMAWSLRWSLADILERLAAYPFGAGPA